MNFEDQVRVRFADCDPAGIVYFPRYLDMLNHMVENWFDDALDLPYAGVIGTRRIGLPTVHLEVDFTAVSRHGEILTRRLMVQKMGRTSLDLRIEFFGGEELRLRARQVLVCTSLETHRPMPLPDDLREAIAPYAAPAEAAP